MNSSPLNTPPQNTSLKTTFDLPGDPPPRSWRIGFVGLGKLGMPVALALALKGHDVIGYDVDPERMQKDSFRHREIGPNGEPSIESLLKTSTLRFGPLEDVVRHAEVILLRGRNARGPVSLISGIYIGGGRCRRRPRSQRRLFEHPRTF